MPLVGSAKAHVEVPGGHADGVLVFAAWTVMAVPNGFLRREGKRPGRPLLTVGALLAILLAALATTGCGEDTDGPSGAPEQATFVAPSLCARCHHKEHENWKGSHHHLAMQVATQDTVLADFGDTTFEKNGVVTRFFRDGDAFVVNTEDANGTMRDFVVTHAFGVDPLQQYLVEVGNGHVQVLPTCWDVKRKQWFHIYDEPIPHGDPLHWTGPYMNWNYMCAECHTTDLVRGFDLETLAYDTTYFDDKVGCQACHGPGSEHVAWAEGVKAGSGTYDESDPKGLVVDLAAADSSVQIDTCARCHARRNVGSGVFGHGDPLLDHYDPELLVAPLYHPDGQILDEVYVYGSFLQAKKYHRGVRCTDCHDPHTTLPKAEGNALCTTCHQPDPPARFPTLKAKTYDSPEHHHHTPGQPGALCVECHMPATTYMQVDPRRDHGFHLPRPDLSETLGVPNPCTSCHEGEDAAWASASVRAWFPEGVVARTAPHFAEVFARARRAQSDAVAGLVGIVRDEEQAAIVRATALRELGRFASPLVLEVGRTALDDPEDLVRLAAIHLVRDVLARGASPQLQQRKVRLLVPRLEDDRRVLRGEAARALADVRSALPTEKRSVFEAALGEYVARQEALRDRADAHLNLGALYAELGDPARAEAAYRTALRVDPAFLPVRFNLAMLLNGQGRNEEAETMLREVIARLPGHGEAHYSLGLLLAELERYGDAAASLSDAAALLPGRPRIHYNRALTLQRLGRNPEALAALTKAHELAPKDPGIVHALALACAELRRWTEARRWARKLIDLAPEAPEPRRLLAWIDEQARR